MVELGVFLPVGNNGWIMSESAPQYLPTWELNRDVSLLAEEIGLDYLFSMAKWRGVGGSTRFWDFSIESLTLMSSLAPLTRRVRLITSVSPTLMHPAVFAKMAATLDAVSGGRFTLNIVSAGNELEYGSMGLLPENFESFRYDFTEEWVRIAKALWTEPSVTFHGRYFDLVDCRSDPKPLQRPHPPIVCASASERGQQFVAEHCDAIFVGGHADRLRASTPRLRELAAMQGRTVKTHALVLLTIADSDADAQRRVEQYHRGPDWGAMANVYGRGRNAADGTVDDVRERLSDPKYLYYFVTNYAGGPETIANVIEELAEAGADGLVLTFDDFLDGLHRLGRDIMPILRRRGVLPAAAEATTSGSPAG